MGLAFSHGESLHTVLLYLLLGRARPNSLMSRACLRCEVISRGIILCGIYVFAVLPSRVTVLSFVWTYSHNAQTGSLFFTSLNKSASEHVNGLDFRILHTCRFVKCHFYMSLERLQKSENGPRYQFSLIRHGLTKKRSR